jgi:hypothetical protein
MKTARLIINERSITPLPMMEVIVFDKTFLARPFIRKPANGNKGIR